jgi:hypothetical protein
MKKVLPFLVVSSGYNYEKTFSQNMFDCMQVLIVLFRKIAGAESTFDN